MTTPRALLEQAVGDVLAGLLEGGAKSEIALAEQGWLKLVRDVLEGQGRFARNSHANWELAKAARRAERERVKREREADELAERPPSLSLSTRRSRPASRG